MTRTSTNRSASRACCSRRACPPSWTYGTAVRTTGRTGRTWWIGTYERRKGRRPSHRPREHVPRTVHRDRQPQRRFERRARRDGGPRRCPRDRAAALRRARRPDQPRGPVLPRSLKERGVAGNHRRERSILVGGGREVLRMHARARARRRRAEDRRPTEQVLHPRYLRPVAAQPAVAAQLGL